MVSFVFLDGKSYVSDSLMRLETVPLLYFLARKKGKESVCIIRRGSREQEVSLFLPDSRTAELINHNINRQSHGFFRKHPVTKAYQAGEENRIDIQEEAFEELMCFRLPRVLKEQDNAAIIIDLAVFCRCFRSMSGFREAYLSLSGAGKEGKDRLWLVAENQENTLDLLVGKDSIFRVKEGGRSLSPELTEMMEHAPDLPLFSEMRRRLGSSYSLVQDYSERGVRNTILRVQLNRVDGRLLSRKELEQMTWFLMRCRRSAQYQLQAGELSGVSHASSTHELEQLLMQPDVFEEVRRRAGQLSQAEKAETGALGSEIAVLKKTGSEESEEIQILPEWMERHASYIDILNSIDIFDPEMKEQVEQIRRGLEDMIRELSCARASEADGAVEEDLKEIAGIMKYAAVQGDYRTVECGLEVLEKRPGQHMDAKEDALLKGKTRLDCSERMFRLNRDIMRCRIELSGENEQQQRSRKEAAAYIDRYPWLKTVVSRLKTGASEELDADTHMKMMEFTRLTREAARHEAALRAILSRLHTLQEEYEQVSRQFEQLKYSDFMTGQGLVTGQSLVTDQRG